MKEKDIFSLRNTAARLLVQEFQHLENILQLRITVLKLGTQISASTSHCL